MKNFLLKYFDEKLIDIVLNSKKYTRIYGIVNSPLCKKDKIDIDIAIKLYIEYKLPIYKIAMLFGVSDVTLRTYFLNSHIELKGHKIGKNSDNKYFSNINSCDKAYFLGLIFADGSIKSSNNKKNLSITLTETDSYILELFNEYANLNSNLFVSHKEDLKPRKGLSIHSSQIYDDLINLGVEENKSKKLMTIPKIRKKLIPHFIRGYFDGDGIAKSNGYIGFCGDYNMLSFIKEELIKECNVNNNKITFNKSNNIYYIQWSSKKDRNAIFNYLYKNKKDLYLKRKYKKIKLHL